MSRTSQMTFDFTINVGNILVVLSLLAAIVRSFYSLRMELTKLEMQISTAMGQVGKMEEIMVEHARDIKKFSDVLVLLARQDERLNAMDLRNDDRFKVLQQNVDDLKKAAEGG
jgi:hypothetical protein